MKKIAFMFAAAALFVACTENKPAEAEVVAEEPVEAVEPVLTAEDSAYVAQMFEGVEATDSMIQAAYDSILASKQVVEEAVEPVEEAAAPVEETAGE